MRRAISSFESGLILSGDAGCCWDAACSDGDAVLEDVDESGFCSGATSLAVDASGGGATSAEVNAAGVDADTGGW